MIRNYIICATPRSGSNYLCELLSSLGLAGTPEEHLWDPEGTAPEPLAERWPRVVKAGTGANGVFGLKLIGHQAERLERELPAVLGMPGEGLARVLAASLDDPKYIALTRRDHVRQAISFTRAKQTRQWRSMDCATGAPRYDSDAIAESMGFLVWDEANWEEFFARNRITPYRLAYEELESDAGASIHEFLMYLGYTGPPLPLPPARHLRQADEVTEDWVRRFSHHLASTDQER